MDEYQKLLDEAVKASAADQVWRLQSCCLGIAASIPDPDPARAKQAVDLFKALRKERRHEQLQMLGEAFIKAGYEAPKLWTIYAQALIERGSPVAARGVLTLLLADKSAEADKELRETLGLSGRAWKDIGYEAIKAGRRDVAARALKEAHTFYARGLELRPTDPELLAWCGSQRVALSRLAEMNGLAGLPDETAFAGQAAKAVEDAIADPATDPQLLLWLLLGGAELRVALGNLKGALEFSKRAAAHREIDSFMLGSLHRQVSQIWQVGKEEAGRELEMFLMNAIVQRRGCVVLSTDATVQLQARLPGEGSGIPLTAIEYMLRCAKSVALIRQNLQPLGTGFVVDAEDLGLAGGGKVVLTNAHVVSNPPPPGNAAVPAEVRVQFGSGRDLFRVKKIVDSLPVDGHDCTALQLERLPKDIEALPVADARFPGDGAAYVVGHPLGQEITFSLLNAMLVGCEDFQPQQPQRLQYRSTTDAGSSGSPVFNANWEVIGIHHAYRPDAPLLSPPRSGTHAVNEGVSLASIREAFSERKAKGP